MRIWIGMAVLAMTCALPVRGADLPEVLVAHLRCGMRKGGEMKIEYRCAEDTALHFVSLHSNGISDFFGIERHNIDVKYGHVDGGVEKCDSAVSVDVEHMADGSDSPLSLRLMPRRNGIGVSVGSLMPEYEAVVAVRFDPAGGMTASNNRKSNRIFFHMVDNPVPSCPWTEESVDLSELAHCEGCAGPWIHYDVVREGEDWPLVNQYSLWSVPDDDGLLLYAARDGESVAILKGILAPLPIDGVYELTWRDADGAVLRHDNTAVLVDNMLTLNFPAWQTSIVYIKKKSDERQ